MDDHLEEQAAGAGSRMTVVEHLAEFRRRLIISIIAVAIGSVVAFVFFGEILDLLIEPYREITCESARGCQESLIFTDPLEAFATRLKVAGYGGLVLASPVVLFQLWRFITPGLYPREKRYAIPFVLTSVLLFLFGGFVAIRTFPQALDFLLTIGGDELTPLLTAGKYLSLITLMILAFGLAFEFPVVLMFLLLARVITTAQLRRYRRWVVIGVVVFSAVITPSGDPYSQLFMAVPMYVFYEAVILIGRLMKR
ncbi:MAG TPA: twin-arginine translocase subunit TatC [Acidimicrobiia bacterium]|nr:twin-arginine translocase subunit TatC [Acidimicrobiia bacterium]